MMKSEDIHQRINYLYQAAYQCLKKTPGDVGLCRFYVFTLQSIVKRMTIHLHPSMKRNLCKRCCIILLPGVTSIVRLHTGELNEKAGEQPGDMLKKKDILSPDKGKQKQTLVTCLECGTIRRYINKPNYTPSADCSQQWTDVMLNGKYVHSKLQQKHSKQLSKKQKQKQMASLAKLELEKQNADINDIETVTVNVQIMESDKNIAKGKECRN